MDIAYAPYPSVCEAVATAIAARTPLSMIRIGDGEVSILRWRDEPPERVAWVLQRAFGRHDYSDAEKDAMRSELIEAIGNADILGVPPADHYKPQLAPAQSILRSLDLIRSQIFTSPGLHFQWQVSDFYAAMLRDRSRIGIITSRPAARPLRAAFNIRRVDRWPVPQEARYARLARRRYLPVAVPHWPDRFEEIRATLRVEPGQVVLVGAGHLGKSYVNWVKQRGGIGLDIGSVFDAWLGIQSRGIIKPEHRLRTSAEPNAEGQTVTTPFRE